MGETPRWPAYLSDEIVLGRTESGVGVCCLWTDRRRLAAKLDPTRYAALGNLYSAGGIGPLVRNLLANPTLRYLVVCGVDLTHTGETLVALFRRGLDAQHRVEGTSVPFDPQVPTWAVDEARRRVHLVDLRGVSDAERINAALAALEPLPPEGEPLVFPQETPVLDVLPSEEVGYSVRQQTIARAWLDGLKLVTQFGAKAQDADAGPARELLHLTTTLWEPPDRIGIPSWLPLEETEIARGLATLLGEVPEGEVHAGYAEVRGAVIELGRQLTQSRAAEVVASRREDTARESFRSGPRLLQGAVREGRLMLAATFGRLELFREWPCDALVLRRFQAILAERLGLEPDRLVIVMGSGWLDQQDEERVLALLKSHYPRLQAWQSDPRGIFRIRVEDGKIVVEHAVENLGPTGRQLTGTSAERLYKAVVNERLVLLPEHGAYLGSELQKAETALRLGISYRQDEPLDLRPL